MFSYESVCRYCSLFRFPLNAAAEKAGSTFTPVDASPYFDIPVTYNTKVKWWINYFQTTGRKWFRTWLERSHAYLPQMQKQLRERGMPQDLAYVAMIESASPHRRRAPRRAVRLLAIYYADRESLWLTHDLVARRAPRLFEEYGCGLALSCRFV